MIKVTSSEMLSAGISSSVQSLIPVIEQQNALIADHAQRLTELESKSEQSTSSYPTNSLVIENIPISVELARAPITIAQSLLDVLKIPEMKSEILEARNFVKKIGSSSFSVLVSFKSNYSRDFVISKKRQFGRLEQSQLFGSPCGADQVFINELLNLPTYKLFNDAKKWKRASNWQGYIWVKESQIYARKGSDRSVKPTLISSLDELIKLA